MKRITDIRELKAGKRIVHFVGEQASFYTFLCIHPNNDKYVLLIDELTQDAPKFYIDNIIKYEWYLDYTMNDVRQKEIEYHERMIESLRKRMNK